MSQLPPVESVLVLSGPNVNLLTDLADLDRRCRTWGRALGIGVVSFHSSEEGALIDRIHAASEDAVIINPGALSHYSYALHDALALRGLPAVEVQLSNVKEREEWRRHSVVEPACELAIWGRGIEGYDWALRHLDAASAMSWDTRSYGPEPDQVGDLRLPEGPGPHPVMAVLHGGFWRDEWRRDIMGRLCVVLTHSGFATWNLEYRRIGPGGGWPATLLDVADGIDYLARVPEVDAGRVEALGHSAGGQLALWAAARARLKDGLPGSGPAIKPGRVVALAPVSDLQSAEEMGLDDHAVSAFLRGKADHSGKYQMASPIALLPLGVPQLIVHGDADPWVPVEMSRRYVEAAQDAGDDVLYAELAEGDHMSLIDPDSDSWRRVAGELGDR